MKNIAPWTLMFIWLGSSGLTSGASQSYSKAVKFAQNGQMHFAFMHYSKILRDFPESKYRAEAMFATGEYYYQNSDFKKAAEAFLAFIEENPQSEDRLYALAYLLSLAVKGGEDLSIDDLEKQIINQQQVSLVFRNVKENTFQSPLGHEYKAVIHIDKIEFYLEGELFAKVAF